MMNLRIPRSVASRWVLSALPVLLSAAVANAQIGPLPGSTATGGISTSVYSTAPSPEVQAAFDEGKQLFDEEKYDEAISKLTLAINIDAAGYPALGAEPYLLRGQAYLKLKEYEEAIKSFGEAIASNANLADAHNGRGEAYRDSGQLAPALDDFKKAVELNRQNKDYLYNLGSLMLQSRQPAMVLAADKILTKVISIDDTMAKAYGSRGQVRALQGKFEDAVADYTRAIELEPTERDYQANLGIALFQMKAYEKSLEAFTAALQASASTPAAEGKDATPEKPELVYVTPLLSRVLVYIQIAKQAASEEIRAEAYQRAIADCQKTMEMLKDAPFQQGDLALAHFRLGVVYQALEQYEEAVRSYSDALRINSAIGGAHVRRGIVWFHLGDDELALADLDEAVQLRPDDLAAHLWRGFTLMRQKKYREAITAYTRALEQKDQYVPALNNRGLAYVRNGQYDKAIEDFNELLRINPKDTTAYFKRGVTYMLLEDYDKAVAALSRATQLDSSYADAQEKLGDAYAMLGQADQARQHHDRAAQLRSAPKPGAATAQ